MKGIEGEWMGVKGREVKYRENEGKRREVKATTGGGGLNRTSREGSKGKWDQRAVKSEVA